MKTDVKERLRRFLFPEPSRIAILAPASAGLKTLFRRFLENRDVSLLDTTKIGEITGLTPVRDVVELPFRLRDRKGFLDVETHHCDGRNFGSEQFLPRVVAGADAAICLFRPRLFGGDGAVWLERTFAETGKALGGIGLKAMAIVVSDRESRNELSPEGASAFDKTRNEFRQAAENAGITVREFFFDDPGNNVSPEQAQDARLAAKAPFAWIAELTCRRTFWTRWRTWMALTIVLIGLLGAMLAAGIKGCSGPKTTSDTDNGSNSGTKASLQVSQPVETNPPPSGVGEGSEIDGSSTNRPSPPSPLPPTPPDPKKKQDVENLLTSCLSGLSIDEPEPAMTYGLPADINNLEVLSYEEKRHWKGKFDRKREALCTEMIDNWEGDRNLTDVGLLDEYYSFWMRHQDNPYIKSVNNYVEKRIGNALIALAENIEKSVVGDLPKRDEEPAKNDFVALNNICNTICGQKFENTLLSDTTLKKAAQKYLEIVKKNQGDFRQTWRQSITFYQVKICVCYSSKPYDVGLRLCHQRWNPDKKKHEQKDEPWILEPAAKENEKEAEKANSDKKNLIDLKTEIHPFDRIYLWMTVRRQGKHGDKVKTKPVWFSTWDHEKVKEIPVDCFRQFFDQKDDQGLEFREFVWQGKPEKKDEKPVEVHCYLYGTESAIRLDEWIRGEGEPAR